MTNIVIGYPNYAKGATYTGGSYVGSLPVTNLGTRELAQVARTTNTNVSSTKFYVDLTDNRVLRTFALVNHNLSQLATVRIKGSTTAFDTSDAFDTSNVAAWSLTFDNLVDWESSVWWIGVAGDEYLRSPYSVIIDLGQWKTARYLTIEISDTANVDGYVQIGYFFAGNAIQPAVNMSYGLQDGWIDYSSVEQSENGTEFFTERRRLRTVTLALDWLSEGESKYFHELQRMCGTVNDILYIPYPDSREETQRYGFLGRLEELSPVERVFLSTRKLPLKIKERA